MILVYHGFTTTTQGRQTGQTLGLVNHRQKIKHSLSRVLWFWIALPYSVYFYCTLGDHCQCQVIINIIIIVYHGLVNWSTTGRRSNILSQSPLGILFGIARPHSVDIYKKTEAFLPCSFPTKRMWGLKVKPGSKGPQKHYNLPPTPCSTSIFRKYGVICL